MKERIKQLIEYYGINVRQFEAKIGSSNGAIYTFLSRGGSLSCATLVKILESCNEISADWLVLGWGPILRSDVQKNAKMPSSPYPEAEENNPLVAAEESESKGRPKADSVPWSRYDAAQQEIGALRTRLEQSAESVARLLKENADLRKNPVSPSPATPKEPIFV